MTVPNFMSKAFSYQDLRGGALAEHDQTKNPGADRVQEKTFDMLG